MSGADILDSATPGSPNVPSSDVPPASGKPAFVAPRTYLDQRPIQAQAPIPLSAVDRDQMEGLKTIRAFLKVRTSYDVLPLSFRLIILDTSLLVKKSLNILMQNGGVTLPCPQRKTAILTFKCRYCLSAALGLKNVNLCRPAHHLRLH
jgi:5'-AMP-activated protein kinase regulatory gamma subunit